MIKDNWCAPSVSKLARDLEEAVKDLWDNRDEGGCCHWPIYYEEDGKEWDVVLGWAEGYDEDPNIYYENGCAICASVRYQDAHNAMQTDMNMDFLMPCNEDGDCWDADVTVSKEEDFNALAKYLLDEGKKMVEEYADKDDEEYDEEDEDFDESSQRRGRMLREWRRPHDCMLKEYVSRYVVYADGSEWVSTEDFEDAKAIADILMMKHDDVEVVAEPGRVHVYGANKNGSRGRMSKF